MIIATMLRIVNRIVLSPRSASDAWICIHDAVEDSDKVIMLSELQFAKLSSSLPADPISFPSH
jgi:hypothetical protein